MLDAVAVLATADTVAAAVEIAVDTVETGESARLARARRLGAACAPSSSETILVGLVFRGKMGEVTRFGSRKYKNGQGD